MRKSILISLCASYAFSAEIKCETGETCYFQGPRLENIVRALKDGPIVYMQDKEGNLYSFSADAENKLTRTKFFRLPVIGTVYNWFFPNTLALLRNPCELTPWAISHTTYEKPDCTTVSLFEMENAYPIEIRNRDPWLFPGFSYMHKGPNGMVGVDLTALGMWVAISGYVSLERKVFAYRKLNYDSAGHNFLMKYKLPGSESVTWQPNALLKRVAQWIGVSQEVVQLPLPDWQMVTLPDNAEPSLLLKRQALLGGKIILTIPLDHGRSFTYFDVEKGLYLPPMESFNSFRPYPWPIPEVKQFVLTVKSELRHTARLNGVRGQIQLLSQEPLYGRFVSDEGISTDIYAVLRSPLDFLFNRIRFFTDKGLPVKLVVGA